MTFEKPYPPEVRERAVRMAFETQDDYGTQWAAIRSTALTNSGEDCRPGLGGEGLGELEGRDIVFGLAGGAAEFDGAINESSDAMQGTWSGVGFVGSGNWSASR